jgi:hypothetical protein
LDQGARLREERHNICDRAIQDKGDRRFTEHALENADLSEYEILKLKELGYADGEGHCSYRQEEEMDPTALSFLVRWLKASM